MELLVAATAGWTLWRGNPLQHDLEARELGHPESYCPEIPSEDPSWSDRSKILGSETIELTQIPVKVRDSPSPKGEKEHCKGETLDTFIVGGAAAGLSVAACCQKKGLTYIVSEKNEKSGDIWRSRYHRYVLYVVIL